MKYPIGIQTFEQLIKHGYVYVDKTGLVYSLATEGKVYFLSRPRRFGKSLLLSTLKAYFQGRKELFAGLKIAELEQEWQSHVVFHIDFNGGNYTVSGALDRILGSILSEWEGEYQIIPDVPEEYGLRFLRVLKAACERSGRRVVVLVDEYDKPLLDVLEQEPELLVRNRETLKAFYSVFKQADEYLRFVFLTGVTKFSQVSVFSGFNQPLDISMIPDYESLCGITEEELRRIFAEPIREMAAVEGCTVEDILRRLKQRYDGYHFGKRLVDIYNPFSVLNAFKGKDISDYWFSSGTPTYLIRLMNHFHEGIDELTGKYYSLDEFVNYKADAAYPLPMIYQSGYLTIKENERERERYFRYTFYLLLRLMSVYAVHLEMEQSQGMVDCVVETPEYVYIFEFKLDGTAAQALRQIQEKGYARPYLSDSRQVRLIGVNFSSETGTVDGWECADPIL